MKDYFLARSKERSTWVGSPLLLVGLAVLFGVQPEAIEIILLALGAATSGAVSTFSEGD